MTMRFRKFLLFLLVLITGAVNVVAKTYIVCIGIQNYPDRANDTYLCVRDAKTIQYLLKKNGYAETMLITDKRATRGNILRAMRQLFTKATERDAVAIFYSGHGDRGAICAYDGNLSYFDIWNVFKSTKAKRRFAFINACFSGTMRAEYDFSALQDKSMMFFMSSRSGEYSLEIPNMKNGLFTAYLQQGLRGSADSDLNKVITARELFDYVSKKVAEASDNKQHPVMWGRFSNDMPVIVWK